MQCTITVVDVLAFPTHFFRISKGAEDIVLAAKITLAETKLDSRAEYSVDWNTWNS